MIVKIIYNVITLLKFGLKSLHDQAKSFSA